jgi:PhnB protein
MQLNPYLTFNGNCEEALNFYEGALAAKVVFKMTYGESPMGEELPASWQKKIIHARLLIEDRTLMASDAMPDNYEKPQGFSVTLNLEDPVESEVIFKALSEGGTVRVPMGETFWAQRFGMVTDRFGTPWMVNCEKSA